LSVIILPMDLLIENVAKKEILPASFR